MSEYVVDMYCEASGVKCEPIVRCRDCEYATVRYSPFHGVDVMYCERFLHMASQATSAKVEPDGFCAWGERREA